MTAMSVSGTMPAGRTARGALELALGSTLACSAEDQELRGELVAFLDAYVPPELGVPASRRQRPGDGGGDGGGIPEWARKWQATLFDHGWLVPSYPPELGGRNATLHQTLVYLEELARRDVPRSLHFPGYAIVAPTLLEWGNKAQRALAPAALRGDTVWCIGMSEPGAGSDVASLATRAEISGDRFIVNGQKVWTSYAMWAQYCLCYVRTGAQRERNRTISVLIVDMGSPGIEVRPLRQITGRSEFAEVFFTDVEVPADNLVGELNGGWQLTRSSLSHERGGLWLQWVAALERVLADLVAEARGRGLAGDPLVRQEIARAVAEVACLRLTGYRGFARLCSAGSAPEHLTMKVATSERARALADLGTRLAGCASVACVAGDASDAEPNPPASPAFPEGYPEVGEEDTDGVEPLPARRWDGDLLVSFAATIAGGTSEIQRDIIAEQVLGLPRR